MRLPNAVVALFAALAAWGQSNSLPLSSLKGHNVKVEPAMYKGKQAIRVTEAAQQPANGDEDRIAIIANSNFRDGTIEADEPASLGRERPRAPEDLSGLRSASRRTYPSSSVSI